MALKAYASAVAVFVADVAVIGKHKQSAGWAHTYITHVVTERMDQFGILRIDCLPKLPTY